MTFLVIEFENLFPLVKTCIKVPSGTQDVLNYIFRITLENYHSWNQLIWCSFQDSCLFNQVSHWRDFKSQAYMSAVVLLFRVCNLISFSKKDTLLVWDIYFKWKSNNSIHWVAFWQSIYRFHKPLFREVSQEFIDWQT